MKLRLLAILPLMLLFAPDASAQSASSGHTVVRPAERVRPPWLGLRFQPKRSPDNKGVEVITVFRRSPAEHSGIREGDVIVAVEGDPMTDGGQIKRRVRTFKAGETVTVTVKRGERREDLEFKLQPTPESEAVTKNHLLGYPAPEFGFRYVGDNKFTHISELRGKPTVLDFWATWCKPCHKVQAQLADIKTEFGDEIHIVGIAEESAKKVRAHLREHPARYAMAIDEESHIKYGVTAMPLIVLLDADHNVAAVIFGASKKDVIRSKLRNLVAATKSSDEE